MKIKDMNWMQVGEYLRENDICLVPIGSTEQHAYLSLETDNILAEKMALDAAEPLGIPVFPVMPFGITPVFMDYPGTVSMRTETLENVVTDILESVLRHGFRKIFIVNGHGGNMPVEKKVTEWSKSKDNVRVRFHNWWMSKRTWEKVLEIDPVASHASWMENFPWTRLPGVVQPSERKPLIDYSRLKDISAEDAREFMGDGSWGGLYERSDEDVLMLWNVAVEETREEIMKLKSEN